MRRPSSPLAPVGAHRSARGSIAQAEGRAHQDDDNDSLQHSIEAGSEGAQQKRCETRPRGREKTEKGFGNHLVRAKKTEKGLKCSARFRDFRTEVSRESETSFIGSRLRPSSTVCAAPTEFRPVTVPVPVPV